MTLKIKQKGGGKRRDHLSLLGETIENSTLKGEKE